MSDKRLCDLSPRGVLRFLTKRNISPSTSRGLSIIAAWLWDKTEPGSRIQLEDFYCNRAGLTLSTRCFEEFLEPVLDVFERCPGWLLELVRPYPLLIAKLGLRR